MSSPADTLRAARIARGFASAAEVARHFGWVEYTYTSHENGNRGIGKTTAAKYAKAFGIDATSLLGLPSSTLQVDADQGVNVEGTAAWGIWRDKSMANVQCDAVIEVPRASRFSPRRAVLIGDQSVNKSIAEGSYAIYEPLNHHEVTTGRLVVLRRGQGNLVELSVRKVQSAYEGKLRLVAHSTETAFREALVLDTSSMGDVEVLGIVVGSYTPL